jgi:hypothetical protein
MPFKLVQEFDVLKNSLKIRVIVIIFLLLKRFALITYNINNRTTIIAFIECIVKNLKYELKKSRNFKHSSD